MEETPEVIPTVKETIILDNEFTAKSREWEKRFRMQVAPVR